MNVVSKRLLTVVCSFCSYREGSQSPTSRKRKRFRKRSL